MQITEISKKDTWNDFILSQTKGSGSEFLQSWEWGMFQRKLGRKIWFLGIENNRQVIGQALIVKYNLPLGKSYLYCPRGPIFSSLNRKALELLIEKIKDLSKQEKAIFSRWDLKDKKYKLKSFKKVKDLQPAKTLILDLKKTEADLLAQMHAKTRYNIRLAQRHGVKVFESRKQEHLNIFLDLLHQTAKREKFKTYPDNYYHQLLNFNPQFARLYFAQHQDKILAVHLLIFFGQTVIYLHGASSREKKEVMAPYLLHWEIIKWAKKKNFCFYDFWGIDQQKWPGLTRFKTGFGGQQSFYPGTYELSLSSFWYVLYRLGKLCFRLF